MNNVKRIIAAGLVGTAVISTGVVASAKTYDEQLQETMDAYKVPANLQGKLKGFADKHVIKDSFDEDGNIVKAEVKAQNIQTAVDNALALLAKHNNSVTELKKNKEDFETIQGYKTPIEDALGVTVVLGSDSSISVTNKKTGEKELVLTKDEMVDAKVQMGGDYSAFAKAVPDLLVYMQVPTANRGDEIPGSDEPGDKPGDKPGDEPGGNPSTGTPGGNKKPADEEQGHEKERQDVLDGVNAIKSDDAAINEAKDKVLKILNDRSCTLDDLKAAKALVEALPDGPEKDALLKAITYIEKYYKFPDGTTAGTALVEATKTPSTDNNNNANSGTTAKTATNFGNVAVAGLGLMTVAGAVFVISKKKIC